MQTTFLSSVTENEIPATPALEALAAAYAAAFRERAHGTDPRGAHPMPALSVIIEFAD